MIYQAMLEKMRLIEVVECYSITQHLLFLCKVIPNRSGIFFKGDHRTNLNFNWFEICR